MIKAAWAYLIATVMLSGIDTLVAAYRYGFENLGVTRIELIAVPFIGIDVALPLHTSLLVGVVAWSLLVDQCPAGRRWARASMAALPMLIAFAVSMHAFLELPFFGVLLYAASLAKPWAAVSAFALFSFALAVGRIAAGWTLRRRLLALLPLSVLVGVFLRVGYVTLAFDMRTPATLTAIFATVLIVGWAIAPTNLQVRGRFGRTTLALGLGLGLCSLVLIPLFVARDVRVRATKIAAYDTEFTRSVLTTKLFFFPPSNELSACTVESPKGEAVGASEPRNVVILVAESLRADHLAGYGYHHVTMPRVEELAGQGKLFERASAPASFTGGSFLAFWTGIGAPTQHGIDQWPPTLPDLLRDKGYVSLGSDLLRWVLEANPSLPERQIFDVTIPVQIPAVELADRTISFIRQHAHQPFLVMAHFFDTHDPHAYASSPVVFPASHLSRYDDALHHVDRQMGRIFDTLRSLGIEHKTAVIITGDHGEFFGEHGRRNHGQLLYEEAIRVPLIIKVPNGSTGRESRPVSGFDIPPTAYMIATGQPWPIPVIGRLIANDRWDESWQSWIVVDEVPRRHDTRRLVAVREDDLKYILFEGTEVEQLYDLGTDPREQFNLAGLRRDELQKMRDTLQDVRARRACIRAALLAE